MYRRWQNQITRIYFPLLQLRWACVTATEAVQQGVAERQLLWEHLRIQWCAESSWCQEQEGVGGVSRPPVQTTLRGKFVVSTILPLQYFCTSMEDHYVFFCSIASNHLRKAMLKGFVLQHTAQCKSTESISCFVLFSNEGTAVDVTSSIAMLKTSFGLSKPASSQ